VMFIGTLQAVSSILISVTINGEKSRKRVCTDVKVDKRLLSDYSTTYRKTFVFTLVQAVAVYSYVAVLYAYNLWVWKQVIKDECLVHFFVLLEMQLKQQICYKQHIAESNNIAFSKLFLSLSTHGDTHFPEFTYYFRTHLM
jgi:hypothetical protein